MATYVLLLDSPKLVNGEWLLSQSRRGLFNSVYGPITARDMLMSGTTPGTVIPDQGHMFLLKTQARAALTINAFFSEHSMPLSLLRHGRN